MDYIYPRELDTDSTGMVHMKHEVLELPIMFLYNEVEKYHQGHIRWHWHPEMEFTMVSDNPVEFFIEDRRIVLRKGEGIWINSNKRHMIKCLDGVHSATILTVLMLPEFIAGKTNPLYRKYVQPLRDEPDLSYVLFLESVEWHREVIEMLNHAFWLPKKREFGYELFVHNEISRVWLTMLQHRKEMPKQMIPRTTSNSQSRLKTMVSYIQKNYAQRITLDQIAAAAHVSRSECIRCFKKHLDVTPVQYLAEHRMEMAARLLSVSREPVSGVAAKCGFDDFSYFARQFKSRYGVTPSQYRKERNR